MELNREQIIKALTMFIEDMPADLRLGFSRTVLFRELLKDALALIRELTEENERLEKKYKLADSEREANVKGFTETIASLRADTVREMQERFSMILDVGEEIATDTAVEFLAKIAKELLEESK